MADVRVQRVGDVDVVTIDRPEVRNALRFRSYDELERAERQIRRLDGIGVGGSADPCERDPVHRGQPVEGGG